jgi:hypothetical protein
MKKSLFKVAVLLAFVIGSFSLSYAAAAKDSGKSSSKASSKASTEESANLLSLRLGSPMMYDFEFERIINSEMGLSVGFSSLSGSFGSADYSITYLSAGVKKYLNGTAPAGSFVSGRLGLIMWSVTEDTLALTGTWPNYSYTTEQFKGDATMLALMGTWGHRWIWGNFTLCPEIGLGYYSLSDITLTAPDGTTSKWKVAFSGIGLVANLSGGIKF